MTFNSYDFFIFFGVVYATYLILPFRAQNLMLLGASYFFYGSWDWRFLGLLFISTVVDWWVGLRLDAESDDQKRKKYLWISLVVNLGILGFFKYFNFFLESFYILLNRLGWHGNEWYFRVILPVGISFYTLQTLSYSIDVYNRKLKCCRSFTDFALFVSYFPQLVAGPIERASHLLPLLTKKRRVSAYQIRTGAFLILYGLFFKIVIADNLAAVADRAYSMIEQIGPESVLLGVYSFAFQIYGDFMGYSTIAIGVSRMMGVDIMKNFNVPYFSTRIDEFWTRWHISLSSWLRDYLYIPLGGNRRGEVKRDINLMTTMLVGGLWHGANWTMIIWGGLHGLYLILWKRIANLMKPIRLPSFLAPVVTVMSVVLVFHLVCFAWIFFRAESLSQALVVLNKLLTMDYSLARFNLTEKIAAGLILVATALDGLHYWKKDEYVLHGASVWLRIVFYVFLMLSIIFCGGFNSVPFIYFQF